MDLHANSSSAPGRPLRRDWTYIRSDFRLFRFNQDPPDPFVLFLDEVETVMGTRSGLQVNDILMLLMRAYSNECWHEG